MIAGDDLLEIRHGLATDPIVEVLDRLLLRRTEREPAEGAKSSASAPT